MIDITSSNSAVFKALESRITGTEGQAKAAAIEKASKVGTEQHQRTMNFLVDKFSASLAQQTGEKGGAMAAAASEASTEETKKQAKRQADVSDSKTKKGNETSTSSLMGQAAATEVSYEETKKEAQKSNAQKTQTDAGQNSSASQPTIIPSTDPNGGKPTTAPNVAPNGDRPTILPMEPPSPPPPEKLPPGFSIETIAAESLKDHNVALTKIMISMSNLLSEGALEQVESNRQYQVKTSEANLEEVRRIEAEQIEDQRKADQAQEASSCIFQVVSIIVSVVLLVVGAVTMNPALAVTALLGLLLTATDAALAASGQTTLTSHIVEPLFEHVIKPMADFFAGVITEMLMAFGVDEKDAEIVGAVLGQILAIATIIVAAVLVKKTGLIQAAMGRMMTVFGSVLSKITPNVGKTMAQNISTKMGSLATSAANRINIGGSGSIYNSTYAQAIKNGSSISEAAAQASLAAKEAMAGAMGVMGATASNAAQGFGLAGSLAGGSAQIAGSVFRHDVNLNKEQMIALFASISTSTDLMSKVQEYFQGMLEDGLNMMEEAVEAQGLTNQTAIEVLRNMAKNV